MTKAGGRVEVELCETIITYSNNIATSKMIDVLLNPVQPQVVPRQEQKRLQLQKERADEMKRFLAQQASNSHPRLVRLLKKHENPSAPITEIMLPQLGGNRGSVSQKPQARPPDAVLSPISQAQPQTTYNNSNGSDNYQQQQAQQQMSMNLPQMPPRDSIYGFPSGVVYQQQYPTMQYQPNPYLPPFHYSPVSYTIVNLLWFFARDLVYIAVLNTSFTKFSTQAFQKQNSHILIHMLSIILRRHTFLSSRNSSNNNNLLLDLPITQTLMAVEPTIIPLHFLHLIKTMATIMEGASINLVVAAITSNSRYRNNNSSNSIVEILLYAIVTVNQNWRLNKSTLQTWSDRLQRRMSGRIGKRMIEDNPRVDFWEWVISRVLFHLSTIIEMVAVVVGDIDTLMMLLMMDMKVQTRMRKNNLDT